ncbi:MAG: putative Ig domain-containing protein, partial [Caldilineaceae bacterium]|nr:putative Ig domain-containing protein [Caldilineaceae bacterium]
TITYGASGLPPGLSINPSTGEITGSPTEVGKFDVTITASNGIAPNATYGLEINVVKRKLRVRAENEFIEQNDPLPPLTVTYSGFAPSEDASVLDTPPVLSTTSDTSVAGTFPIVLSTPLSDDHYEQLSFEPATLTITPQAIPTVTWPIPADIPYGTPLDITQLNATANVSGTFVYSPAKGTVLPAGAGQPLTVVFTPIDTGYIPVTKTNQITVTRVPLTVTASNKAAITDDLLPLLALPHFFTAQYEGFVNGDGPTDLDTPPSFAVRVGLPPFAPGTYDIVPRGAADANYTIAFVKGTLTLTPPPMAPVISDFPPSDGDYGIPYHEVIHALSNSGGVTFTIESGSLPPGLSFNSTPGSGVAVIEGTPTNAGTFGPLVIRATNDFSSTLTPPADIKVQKGILVITADDRTIKEGTSPEPPALTGSVSGLRNGDTVAVLSPAPDFSTPAAAASPLGNYEIVLANAPANANYIVRSVKGTLTIVDKEVPVITWPEPADIVYGTALDGTQLNATASISGTNDVVTGTFVY